MADEGSNNNNRSEAHSAARLAVLETTELERLKELKELVVRLREEQRANEADRIHMREEQLRRERTLQKEIEARDAMIADRERHLRSLQVDLESRQKELAERNAVLLGEIQERQAQLARAQNELEQEKLRYNEESRMRLEKSSTDYVQEALESLASKEDEFHKISRQWSWLGAGALASGLGFFLYVTFASLSALPSQVTWEFITFSALKGLVAVVLLASIARYAYLFSNGYMREALKNADRRHAIKFGKFYLESYGAAADWSQVKEAFEHWNISGPNAFTTSESPLDLSGLDKAASILERLSRSLHKAKSG